MSNPKLQILDTLSKFSHDSDPEVAHNAILAMGIAGAGGSYWYTTCQDKRTFSCILTYWKLGSLFLSALFGEVVKQHDIYMIITIKSEMVLSEQNVKDCCAKFVHYLVKSKFIM